MPVQKNSEAAVNDFVLAVGLLVRRIRADAPPEFQDFSWTQKAVLSRLEKEGPATTAELARAECVKPQSMAAAIAFLEEKRLVERKPHPSDGRQFNIKLTSQGVALRKSINQAKLMWLSQAMAKLSQQERATLFKAGEFIKRMAESL